MASEVLIDKSLQLSKIELTMLQEDYRRMRLYEMIKNVCMCRQRLVVIEKRIGGCKLNCLN